MPRTTTYSPNLAAALDTLAVSELTQALLDVTDDGYNVLVGSTPSHPITFASYVAHPDDLNARFNSTAAGRYQFIHRTWLVLSARLVLPDFSPESQDEACVELLHELGALDLVEAGDFYGAIAKCANTWASLPGGLSGQHQQKLQFLRDTFTQKGGTIVLPQTGATP